MRVFQFIMLFLALVVVCGCSHRRIHRTPVATSVCSCEACQHEQQQLIDSGAVPENYFERSEAPETSETITPETIVTTNEDLLFCLLYTSPSPRDQRGSRMPSSA